MKREKERNTEWGGDTETFKCQFTNHFVAENAMYNASFVQSWVPLLTVLVQCVSSFIYFQGMHDIHSSSEQLVFCESAWEIGH